MALTSARTTTLRKEKRLWQLRGLWLHVLLAVQFFFQLKGDMCLKIVEKGVHKDVVIKEGEVGGYIRDRKVARCNNLYGHD